MHLEINNTEKYLRTAGIKPSIQRLQIFEYLYEQANHPTVDTIFNSLSNSIPTLSKTTVYNTLKLFIDKGIVQIINIEDNETRFDANINFHAHFKCKKCEKVYDIPLENIDLPSISTMEHTITETHYYLKGNCKNCNQIN